MPDLKSILDDAEREGVIPPQATDRLLPFLVGRGVRVDPEAAAASGEARRGEVFSDTETPSFVRGFHDVLITIGIVVALSGLWGLASIYAVLPAILVLAEVLIRRQRLALPAVALTAALAVWVLFASVALIGSHGQAFAGGGVGLEYTLAFPVVLGLFYLLYRVPLAFALTSMGALVVALQLMLRLLGWLTGDPLFAVNHTGVLSTIAIICAIGLFALAMRFDLKDPLRRTTQSDIAFWLHLGAAPALLYSIVSVFDFNGGSLLSGLQTVSARTPVVGGHGGGADAGRADHRPPRLRDVRTGIAGSAFRGVPDGAGAGRYVYLHHASDGRRDRSRHRHGMDAAPALRDGPVASGGAVKTAARLDQFRFSSKRETDPAL